MEEEVKNLETANFINVYGVAKQIHQELNLTKSNEVTLDLFRAHDDVWKAENVQSIQGARVREIKLRVLNYLKEISILYATPSPLTARLIVNRDKFYEFYGYLRQRSLANTINQTKLLIDSNKVPNSEKVTPATQQTAPLPPIYEITFKDGIIFLNNIYMTKPQFGSINYDFFEFLYSNPNERHSVKEIREKINSPAKKTVHQILSDLKFKGELKNLFFKASSTAVEFRNPITPEILKSKDIEYLNLVEIGRNLVENHKK
jgi:hypothetical protein